MKRKGKATNAQGYLVCDHERGPDDPTGFDEVVKVCHLSGKAAEVLAANATVKTWVRQWYRQRFVPENVLDALHLTYPEN